MKERINLKRRRRILIIKSVTEETIKHDIEMFGKEDTKY